MEPEPLLTLKEIIIGLAFVLSNLTTFWATRSTARKTDTETNALSVDIAGKLWKAYEEMRTKEDEMFKAKRLVENELDDCLEGKQNCKECMSKIKKILDEYGETDDEEKSKQLRASLLKLKEEIDLR